MKGNLGDILSLGLFPAVRLTTLKLFYFAGQKIKTFRVDA